VEALFIEMGFDRVFSPSTNLLDVARLLRADIAAAATSAQAA